MTSLLSQFVRSGASAPKDPPTPQVRKPNAKARYAAAFATPTTVRNACQVLGAGHVTVLNQCYRYEKNSLIRRAGRDPETGALLFVWCG